MNEQAIKSMMNPIRIKIIQELTQKKEATTKQLQEVCGEIPQATLYRHISALEKAGIIYVISENRIRGIIEKVYAIKSNPAEEVNRDLKKLTREDFSTLYAQFTISLITDFENYMRKDDALERINRSIGFQSSCLSLSDDELVEMMREISSVIQKRINNEAAPNRRLRKISTILTTS